MVTIENFSHSDSSVKLITIENEHRCVQITNYGATIVSIKYKGEVSDDVVLGYESLEDYQKGNNYFGATIGPVANRIKDAQFTLHNLTYNLEKNNYANNLHSGKTGFHQKVFTYEIVENGIAMFCTAKDGEGGFPGNRNLKVMFILNENSLKITYEITTDKDTVVNLTNHSYFNLNGHNGKGVEDHLLIMNCDGYAKVNEEGLTYGEVTNVANTPFDFTKGKAIGLDIEQFDNVQIANAKGYDHYFKVNDYGNYAAKIFCKETNRTLTITTDLPGFHFYVPNYDEKTVFGKQSSVYEKHCAFCIETSFMPDSIHLENPSPTILKKHDKLKCFTIYTFD